MDNSSITSVTGTMIPLRGDDIDTDRIIPARYLRCVTFDGLGEHAFEDDKAQDPGHAFNDARYRQASILIAAKNFGCGSSREHAPQALNKWGINAVVGQSFAEIFFANCQAMGVPCITVDRDSGERLFAIVESDPAAECRIDIASASIGIGDQTIAGTIPDGAKRSLLEGTWNATAVLLESVKEIDAVAGRIPYLNNFAA